MSERELYKEAFYEWLDKTEWVQKTGTVGEIGKHRADILRERIEALEEKNNALQFESEYNERALRQHIAFLFVAYEGDMDAMQMVGSLFNQKYLSKL